MSEFPKSRMALRAAIVAGVGAAALLVASPAVDASPKGGPMACPTTEEIVSGFNKGLGKLVEDGEIGRAEAKDARAQFASWAKGEDGLGCAIRDGMMETGSEMLDFLGLSYGEMKEAYLDGQSLSQMAAANGKSEAELIAFLENEVDDGLDAFVAAGAFDRSLADVMDQRAEEHIAWAVDYQRGDEVPGHDGK